MVLDCDKMWMREFLSRPYQGKKLFIIFFFNHKLLVRSVSLRVVDQLAAVVVGRLIGRSGGL